MGKPIYMGYSPLNKGSSLEKQQTELPHIYPHEFEMALFLIARNRAYSHVSTTTWSFAVGLRS
jgi:hypothetical protein